MSPPVDDRTAQRTFRRFRRVAWIFRFVRPIFAKVDVRYLGDTPEPGPIIFVSNHRSFFDIPVGLEYFLQLGITPQIAVHRRFFTNRLVSELLRYVGAVPVEAGTGEQWLSGAAAELDAGRSVALMPEGQITSESATVERLRTGVVRLAEGADAPVLPIGVSGTDTVWPLGRPLPRLRLRRPTIVLTVGAPMLIGDASPDEFISLLAITIDELIDSSANPAGAAGT